MKALIIFLLFLSPYCFSTEIEVFGLDQKGEDTAVGLFEEREEALALCLDSSQEISVDIYVDFRMIRIKERNQSLLDKIKAKLGIMKNNVDQNSLKMKAKLVSLDMGPSINTKGKYDLSVQRSSRIMRCLYRQVEKIEEKIPASNGDNILVVLTFMKGLDE